MLKEIEIFYNLTKNRRGILQGKEKQKSFPVSYIHIFHKEYPRLEKINLPKRERPKNLERLFKKRRSIRDFSDKPLSLKQISTVIGSCRIIEQRDKFERRTYPSAGARFPIEIYLIAFNINKTPDGAYHYNSISHSLELLLKKDLTNVTEEIVSPFIRNPSAAIILTSVISRSEVKYAHKAYPFSLIESGHIGQNISLVCAQQKLGCCPIGGYVDDTISEILDLTKNEIPLYVLALGNIRKNDRRDNSPAK